MMAPLRVKASGRLQRQQLPEIPIFCAMSLISRPPDVRGLLSFGPEPDKNVSRENIF
jgi:hypothetical protein